MTIPGIGPITATAIIALAPPAETFAKGRDFAAWLGLTPLQRSTGGKQKIGATSKMGERTIRRLLIIGRARSCACVRTRRAKGFVAGADAGAQASHARDRRVGQQDRSDRLGVIVHRKITELRSRRREIGGREVVESVVGRRRVWRNGR